MNDELVVHQTQVSNHGTDDRPSSNAGIRAAFSPGPFVEAPLARPHTSSRNSGGVLLLYAAREAWDRSPVGPDGDPPCKGATGTPETPRDPSWQVALPQPSVDR